MEELNVYVLTRDWMDTSLVTWNVEATESEIKRLVEKIEDVEYCTCEYYIDNSVEVSHQFDHNRVLWCRTSIKI